VPTGLPTRRRRTLGLPEFYINFARLRWIGTIQQQTIRLRRVVAMHASASDIEREYLTRIDALLPKGRVAQSAAMFQWSREMIRRQLIKENVGTPMSDGELKWRIALRMYGGEPSIVALIQRRLENVSG
jgi:hypothetical protein